jgi:RNA polymerase sigma-70 factor (ECF subfamily)
MPLHTGADHSVTRLLEAWREGDLKARERLMVQVYDELRSVARRHLRGERAGHTLQPTSLVHEAYERLAGQETPFQNRAHFFAVAAQAMRRVLVDRARERLADKRGGTWVKVSLDHAEERVEGDLLADVLHIDRALGELKALDPRQEQILTLRCFAGLSVEETAAMLDVSPTTVKREWRLGRAWLTRYLKTAGARDPRQ